MRIQEMAEKRKGLELQLAAKQAEIDALMLEYCPNEMTEEQKAEWAAHQVPISDEEQAAIDKELGK